MIVHLCEHPDCDQRATINATYDSDQPPLEICSEHVCWPADLALTLTRGGTVTLHLKPIVNPVPPSRPRARDDDPSINCSGSHTCRGGYPAPWCLQSCKVCRGESAVLCATPLLIP